MGRSGKVHGKGGGEDRAEPRAGLKDQAMDTRAARITNATVPSTASVSASQGPASIADTSQTAPAAADPTSAQSTALARWRSRIVHTCDPTRSGLCGSTSLCISASNRVGAVCPIVIAMIRLDIGVDYWSGIRTSMNARRGSVAVRSADSVVPADVRGCDMGDDLTHVARVPRRPAVVPRMRRSEEHTSELQSLMRISSAVFCSKTKKNTHITTII